MSATVLELEAKRLEVMKRRHQLQLSQMVSYEMERKQMQVRDGIKNFAACPSSDPTTSCSQTCVWPHACHTYIN